MIHLSFWGMLLFYISCPFVSLYAEVSSYSFDSFLSDGLEQADREYESEFLFRGSSVFSRDDDSRFFSSSFSSSFVSSRFRVWRSFVSGGRLAGKRSAVSHSTSTSTSVSALRSWILSSSSAKFSDRRELLDADDPVFFYLEENRRLSFQWDFFLNVTCDPKIYLSRIHSFANSSGLEHGSASPENSDDGFGFFADCFAAVLRRGSSDSFSDPSFRCVNRFESRSGFVAFLPSFFSVEDPDIVLSLLKFHRYLSLLFHFPPNFAKGLILLC
ncbi:hypothetical protein EHQ12_16480 [Leptospira gomenensis]|uniref:Uncharacterized protein n=1 Tax=Leptospira gomenensis TaxID=2484974 RepID=A0A5F1YKQ3_9LEPT|nr:hypothetical protein [Leptospira gomenensis]TGK34324.1 hypothetical protein EHQ12_16480 [Leptospira gomenensis]TGK37314.1 hypothetical protein EHQ17_03780 [Leptospira gomenensis]TGK51001.1 hypothetical protein EHQ07_03845 [Leptospira gomenensis]TGK56623.1 hypothetical protein EHQ13_15770 [Leptospira gomenensis]